MKFTVEEIRPDGAMPFLDPFITPEPEITLTTGIFDISHTCTNIYSGTVTITKLQNIVSSMHLHTGTYSVIHAPTHRDKVVCRITEL